MASNVIAFPVRDAKRREEIQHLRDWRDQIFKKYPDLPDLGKSMADVLLTSIARDLGSYGVAASGRAA